MLGFSRKCFSETTGLGARGRTVSTEQQPPLDMAGYSASGGLHACKCVRVAVRLWYI
jgi:hypothetical protein